MDSYGVILIDHTEIIFRIYETDNQVWKLSHYHSAAFPTPVHQLDALDILEVIDDFLARDFVTHTIEWKLCSRYLPQKLLQETMRLLDMPIEEITHDREQELLCKGMFTELW